MAIGAFGPWARAFIVTVSGLDGDGWIVLIAAIVAGVMLYLYARGSRRNMVLLGVAALMGVAALATVIYDGKDIFGTQTDEGGFFEGEDLITPGWGIVMAGLASASLIAASVTLAVRERRATPRNA
jgi:hypothetical protein